MSTKITIKVTDMKFLAAPITNWNEIDATPPTEDQRAWYSEESSAGYGVQCGGVLVLQSRVGQRDTGMFGPESIVGDIVVHTPHVIRGGGPIAFKWVPSPAADGTGTLEYADRA